MLLAENKLQLWKIKKNMNDRFVYFVNNNNNLIILFV